MKSYTNKPDIDNVFKLIINWFKKNKKEHFFRQNRTPYSVWISEVILQQTRLVYGISRIENFLIKFPNVQTLALAKESEVLNAFQGLGYYNRARNLHKGAIIINNYFAEFPSSYQKLLSIPSIGPYTASLICSVCFQKPYPAIDTNIARITSRIYGEHFDDRKKLFTFTDVLFKRLFLFYKPEFYGIINEAFMEFGQEVCKSKNPLCEICFISSECIIFLKKINVVNFTLFFKKPVLQINWNIYIIEYKDLFLLFNWNDMPILKKFTGFASELIYKGQKYQNNANLKEIIKNKILPIGQISQRVTHHNITFFIHYIKLDLKTNIENGFWVNKSEIIDYFFSSVLNKIWEKYLDFTARGGI